MARYSWILVFLVGLCLSPRFAHADNFSGRYLIYASFQCPYYLLPSGEWDFEFRHENRQFRPCSGLHVIAKQPGIFGDSYCGEDYTAADGSVRIRATTDCDGDVFLTAEASSLQGFRVGTHDFPWWRAPLDAWLAYVTAGLAIPGEVYDFLVANRTFEWNSQTMTVHAGTGDRVNFGAFAVGDTNDHNSAMAADVFPIASLAISQLQNSGHLPNDLAITINQPVFGTPTTIWDTVIFKDSNARDPSQYPHMIRSIAHEIGHATYNRYHSGQGHWLTDARFYLSNHYWCEPLGTLRFAWYEGFADFIESYVYPSALRQRGGLELTENPRNDPFYHLLRGCYWDNYWHSEGHDSERCTQAATGFNHEGNVQALLDQVYYGPYRRAYASDWDPSPAIPGMRARDPHRPGRGQMALVASADRSTRAFSLASISDVFAWVEAAGSDSHTAREFLDHQISPWCTSRDITDRYCSSATFQNEMRFLDASSLVPEGCPALDPSAESSGTPLGTNVQLKWVDGQSNAVTAIHFGPLAPGDTRQSTVNLLNAGTDPVSVDYLAFADAANVFHLLNPPSLPLQLAPNARTAVTLSFSPMLGNYSTYLFASSSLIEGLSLPGGSAGVQVDGSGTSLCGRVTVSTIAGTGQSGQTDGPANTATFASLDGMAVASNGDIFVVDGGNHAIRRLSTNGIVSTFSTGNSPAELAIDASGRLYYTSICRIFAVDSTGTATPLAGSTTCGFQDGTGQNAEFNYPLGIAVHTNGTVYVADLGNHRIRAITPAGMTTSLAGSGADGSADGVGTAASFGIVSGLALHGDTLYVTDFSHGTIRQIDVNTRAVTTRLPANVLGPQTFPAAILADNSGNLIFTTHRGDTINFVAAGSSTVERLAGNTSQVPEEYADGPGCDARFDDAEGLVLANGRLVLADSYNRRIRQATLP